MAKIELRGIIEKVSDVELIGENQTEKQTIILSVAAYRDEFGDEKGKPEKWQLEVLGKDRVKNYGFNKTFIGLRAKVKVYVNSREVVSGSKSFYAINAVLAEIEFPK